MRISKNSFRFVGRFEIREENELNECKYIDSKPHFGLDENGDGFLTAGVPASAFFHTQPTTHKILIIPIVPYRLVYTSHAAV